MAVNTDDLMRDVRVWLYMSDDVKAYAVEHDRLCATYTSQQMLAAIRELLDEKIYRDSCAMDRPV